MAEKIIKKRKREKKLFFKKGEQSSILYLDPEEESLLELKSFNDGKNFDPSIGLSVASPS